MISFAVALSIPHRRLTARSLDRLRDYLLVGLWCLFALPSAAQLPKLPGTAAPPAAKAPAESPEQTSQRITKSLADARQQLIALDTASPTSLPPGITAHEVADRRSDLIRTVFNLERHLNIIDSSKIMTDAAKDAVRRETEWRGFDSPPPYSFLLYDELRNQRESAQAKLDAYHSTVALVNRQILSQQDEFRIAEEANRRAADEAARARGKPEEPTALWRLQATTNHVSAIGSALAFYQYGINFHQPRLAVATAELALIDRQLAAIGDKITFTDKDLAAAEAANRTKIAASESELTALDKRQSSLLVERDQARAAVEKIRQQPASDPAAPRPGLEAAENHLRAIEVEVETLSFQMDVLSSSIRLHSETAEAFGFRQKLFTADNTEVRAKARKELEQFSDRGRSWASFVTNERAAVSATIRDQESRLASLPQDDPRRTSEQRALNALWRKNEAIERLDQQVSSSIRDLDRWLADDQKMLAQRSFGQRTSDALAKAWSTLRKLSQIEVYRYSDTIETDGEIVTVKRGLTLIWLLGAVAFFVIGYVIFSKLSRKVQRAIVQRGWVGDAQARTLRRWIMVANGVLLALITLHWLKIPLTAFAFLGGALAIGVGFGTQTLFKNFISGIIVLVEHKVKVGDILDVEGIIGTVTTVDTRSSTVRGFDGVETLIPNSLLLENKVTNWTHSNSRQRRILRVGVAYGSPVQQVSEILADCAARHGLVLKDPAPLVLFEDFGADSLLFALYFWVELSERSNANQIASDMRFMLVKRFNDAGIAIPFPQRDLHFAAGAPLKVEMVQPSPSEPPTPKKPPSGPP
jgi:small-conductance mechanosensitive channel